MVHKVVVRRKAVVQFQSICDYLSEEFGDSIADNFEFEVENCIATLRKFPESGQLEFVKGKYYLRSKIVGKYNKLYYFLDGNKIVIVAFADMRMHPNSVRKAVIG